MRNENESISYSALNDFVRNHIPLFNRKDWKPILRISREVLRWHYDIIFSIREMKSYFKKLNELSASTQHKPDIYPLEYNKITEPAFSLTCGVFHDAI